MCYFLLKLKFHNFLNEMQVASNKSSMAVKYTQLHQNILFALMFLVSARLIFFSSGILRSS